MHLAVVMPAHNEAAGLPGFIDEIVDALTGSCDRLSIVVVDDVSTDETSVVLSALRLGGGAELRVERNATNLGHGPSALRAYVEGLSTGAELILHVDGDGQFQGEELPALVRRLEASDVVHGVRRGRSDEWFRRALTFLVGLAIWGLAKRRLPDANTPLRAYRRDALTRLLAKVPADALVPHLHFSVLERRCGLEVSSIDVTSLPRRGGDPAGTMWGAARRFAFLPPVRLVRFVWAASRELWVYRVRGRRPLRVPLPKAT